MEPHEAILFEKLIDAVLVSHEKQREAMERTLVMMCNGQKKEENDGPINIPEVEAHYNPRHPPIAMATDNTQ